MWALPGGVQPGLAAVHVLRWEGGRLRDYATLVGAGSSPPRVVAEYAVDEPRAGVPVAGPDASRHSGARCGSSTPPARCSSRPARIPIPPVGRGDAFLARGRPALHSRAQLEPRWRAADPGRATAGLARDRNGPGDRVDPTARRRDRAARRRGRPGAVDHPTAIAVLEGRTTAPPVLGCNRVAVPLHDDGGAHPRARRTSRPGSTR